MSRRLAVLAALVTGLVLGAGTAHASSPTHQTVTASKAAAQTAHSGKVTPNDWWWG